MSWHDSWTLAKLLFNAETDDERQWKNEKVKNGLRDFVCMELVKAGKAVITVRQ